MVPAMQQNNGRKEAADRFSAASLSNGGGIGYLPFLCVLHFPSRPRHWLG